MIELNIEVDASQVFKDIGKVLEVIDTTRILDEAGSLVLNRNRQRYLREESPDEIPWVPSQAAIRRRRHGGTGTLFDTGRLFRSIQLADRGSNFISIQTDVFYGPFHQFGLGGHPQREFLGVNDDDAELLERLLARRVQQALA